MLASCGVAIERSEVEQRFRSLFACASPHVAGETGGYLVEGCGVTAHFRCFEGARAYDQRHDGGILGAAFASDTCVLEHSERAPMPRPEERLERDKTSDGKLRLRAGGLVQGGQLEAVAVPETDREHVLLCVHRTARFNTEPCTADLFRNGDPVPVLQVRRPGDHDLRLAIRADSLRGLHEAQRFAGRVCGFDFELSADGRKALSLFEMRFREELARLDRERASAPSSGGEQANASISAPAGSHEGAPKEPGITLGSSVQLAP
jgi:hypothetical protein